MAPPTIPVPAPAPAPAPRRRREGDTGRILLGLVVLALGVIFLLDGFDVLDAGQVIDDWWPAAIVALGALQLLERPRPVLSASLLIAAGGVLLLFTTGAVDESAWDVVWPLALVAGGLAILSRWRGPRAAGASSDEDAIVATGIFGGPSVASASPAFRRASLTAIFGGVTLDLRHARPAPEGATVTATAVFGGVDILVPRGWRITTRSTPIFGGVDDKTDQSAELPADAPVLRVDALAVFGGVGLKHGKD